MAGGPVIPPETCPIRNRCRRNAVGACVNCEARKGNKPSQPQRHRDTEAAAQEAACRAIEENQIIRLSVEDQRAFAEAILDPPAPSKGLLRAADAYRNLIKDSL